MLMALENPQNILFFFPPVRWRYLMHQFVFILQTVSCYASGLSHKVMCSEQVLEEIGNISSLLI